MSDIRYALLAVRTSGMHCTSAVRTSGMHCTSIRIFWYALHFRVTPVVVQLLVVRHRHSQLSVAQLLVVRCTGRVPLGHFWYALHFRATSAVVQLLVVHRRHSQLTAARDLVCRTGRVSSGPSSLASAYRLSNTPLPLVVWAICAALSAVAILQRWS